MIKQTLIQLINRKCGKHQRMDCMICVLETYYDDLATVLDKTIELMKLTWETKCRLEVNEKHDN